ncbi:MAG TPA: flagellar motor switch protein FliN [Tepidisphaeraceae bacterium]|nr:flagellar motor switch protein FliN [Tepidisphaeraceae bacterium]
MAAEQSPNAAPDPVPNSKQDVPSLDSAANDALIDQASIDELLKQASFEDPSAFEAAVAAVGGGGGGVSDFAPSTSSAAPGKVAQSASPDFSSLPPAENFSLPNFQQVMRDAQVSSIDLLRDVELNVKIELGRSRMLVEDVLKLAEGSVVELDKLAGDPVDVFVNDRLVARGEVLVLNDNFCVRVNEIVAGVKEEGL